jgi:hypothetical protein
MAYSECLPTRLNPLAERARFSQATSDPYVAAYLVSQVGADGSPGGWTEVDQTEVVQDNLFPQWYHTVGHRSPHWKGRKGGQIELHDGIAGVVLQVMDWDYMSMDDTIGAVFLPVEYLMHKTEPTSETHFLTFEEGTQGQITVEVQFNPDAAAAAEPATYDEVGHPDDFFDKVCANSHTL